MGEDGQASVEFLGVLPFVFVVALVAWELAVAGHAAWMCANAARAAARAEAVGRDGAAAARATLPDALEHGLSVKPDGAGRFGVRLRVPLLLDTWSTPFFVSARAGLEGGS